MARQLRVHPPGGIHHVTARGNDRMSVFRCDADRQLFLSLVGEASERYDCSVLAYCLMDNHIHLTLRDLNGDLSKALRYLNGVYAQRFNLRHGRTGHLFEGRFWNSLLETDSYLATATEYVHRNPVEAGMTARPDEYRWSSFRAYAGMTSGEDFLDQDLVLGLYGHDRGLLRAQTERSRRDEVKESELRKPWPAPVLGSAAFRDRHLKVSEAAGSPDRPLGPQERLDLDRVVAVVAGAFDVGPASIVVPRRGARNEARLAAVYLAAQHSGLLHSQLAEFFGLAAPHSISNVSKRCREAAKERGAFELRLRQAAAELAEEAASSTAA